jgi:hypothetical protein
MRCAGVIHPKEGRIQVLIGQAPSSQTVVSLFRVIREQGKRRSWTTETNTPVVSFRADWTSTLQYFQSKINSFTRVLSVCTIVLSHCAHPPFFTVKHFHPKKFRKGTMLHAVNLKGGSIIVQLTSCLTCLVSCHTADSKPDKQEVNCTVILPPLVFPAPRIEPHVML